MPRENEIEVHANLVDDLSLVDLDLAVFHPHDVLKLLVIDLAETLNNQIVDMHHNRDLSYARAVLVLYTWRVVGVRGETVPSHRGAKIKIS
jgi:hypothetical protein